MDLRKKAAQMAADDEIFKAIGLAALKARARGLEPGDIARMRSCEIVVAEDEEGTGKVVQMILSIKQVEDLASSRAEKLGVHLESLEDRERRDWMDVFLKELKEILEKWQQIKMRYGPGDNLTFEKAVYRRDDSWR